MEFTDSPDTLISFLHKDRMALVDSLVSLIEFQQQVGYQYVISPILNRLSSSIECYIDSVRLVFSPINCKDGSSDNYVYTIEIKKISIYPSRGSISNGSTTTRCVKFEGIIVKRTTSSSSSTHSSTSPDRGGEKRRMMGGQVIIVHIGYIEIDITTTTSSTQHNNIIEIKKLSEDTNINIPLIDNVLITNLIKQFCSTTATTTTSATASGLVVVNTYEEYLNLLMLQQQQGRHHGIQRTELSIDPWVLANWKYNIKNNKKMIPPPTIPTTTTGPVPSRQYGGSPAGLWKVNMSVTYNKKTSSNLFPKIQLLLSPFHICIAFHRIYLSLLHPQTTTTQTTTHSSNEVVILEMQIQELYKMSLRITNTSSIICEISELLLRIECFGMKFNMNNVLSIEQICIANTPPPSTPTPSTTSPPSHNLWFAACAGITISNNNNSSSLGCVIMVVVSMNEIVITGDLQSRNIFEILESSFNYIIKHKDIFKNIVYPSQQQRQQEQQQKVQIKINSLTVHYRKKRTPLQITTPTHRSNNNNSSPEKSPTLRQQQRTTTSNSGHGDGESFLREISTSVSNISIIYENSKININIGQ